VLVVRRRWGLRRCWWQTCVACEEFECCGVVRLIWGHRLRRGGGGNGDDGTARQQAAASRARRASGLAGGARDLALTGGLPSPSCELTLCLTARLTARPLGLGPSYFLRRRGLRIPAAALRQPVWGAARVRACGGSSLLRHSRLAWALAVAPRRCPSLLLGRAAASRAHDSIAARVPSDGSDGAAWGRCGAPLLCCLFAGPRPSDLLSIDRLRFLRPASRWAHPFRVVQRWPCQPARVGASRLSCYRCFLRVPFGSRASWARQTCRAGCGVSRRTDIPTAYDISH
jgi:hypothetical protein